MDVIFHNRSVVSSLDVKAIRHLEETRDGSWAMPRSLPRHPVARPLSGTRSRGRRLSLGRRETEVARRAAITAA
ncbi:hypothetical protein VB636_00840 [Paracoccus sp. APAP_BH8]|uniref:hypothetical protein n=1 Tax=Paracoccus sp. APAP_BH8 TaxID=3110237 RepID=UPI002FD7BB2D